MKCKPMAPSTAYNRTKNLWTYSIILLPILFFQFWNVYNFITDDFSFNTVYQNSEQFIPWFYKISSSFSNKTGAFLLWLTCIACVGFGFILHISKTQAHVKLLYLLQAISVILPLLLSLMLFFTDAFEQANTRGVLSNGIGFKPILYNKYNLFHAPLLFVGFTFYYYMYVVALCSLLISSKISIESNEICSRLLTEYNRYGLLFLFCGVLLGSMWAYNSFGWGGFWNWDPIENAALIPLVVSFGIFISSSNSWHDKRKIIFLLSLLIFPLILFCTFLARGGEALADAMQSIHSYANTNHVELLFILGFLLLMLLSSLILFVTKFHNIDVNNLQQNNKKLSTWQFKIDEGTIEFAEITVLLCIAFVVLVGTCLPLFAGLLNVTIPALDSSFYTTWTMPLVAILMALSNIATAIKCNIPAKKNIKIAFTISCAFLITLLAYINSVALVPELLLIFICSLSIITQLQILLLLVKKKQVSKIGTILVITGLAVFVLATVLQSHFTFEEKIILKEKQKCKTTLDFYCVFNNMKKENYHNSNMKWIANISVFFEKKEIRLKPYFILTNNNIISSCFPDYTRTNIKDIYVQPLSCYFDNNELILVANIIVKPFMIFVWIGSLTIVAGFLFFLIQYKK